MVLKHEIFRSHLDNTDDIGKYRLYPLPALISILILFLYLYYILLLEHNCFTMLCQFLLYNKVTQIYVYISPLPLEPSSHWPPFQPSRSSPSTTLSFPCFRFPFLLYVQQCIYVDATLSVGSTLSFPLCVHKAVLYIYISLPALQIESSVPLFQIPNIHINV